MFHNINETKEALKTELKLKDPLEDYYAVICISSNIPLWQ